MSQFDPSENAPVDANVSAQPQHTQTPVTPAPVATWQAPDDRTDALPAAPAVATAVATAPVAARPWARKLVALIAVAAAFGVLGYLAGPPQSSKASMKAMQDLQDTATKLEATQKAYIAMENHLKQVTTCLDEAKAQEAAMTAEVAQKQAAVAQAEQQVTALKEQLAAAQQSGQPQRDQIDALNKSLAEAQSQVQQSRSQQDALTKEHQALRQQAEQLAQTKGSLEQAKAELTATVEAQQREDKQLKRLLSVLDVGPALAAAVDKAALAEEMPITAKELCSAWGSPSVSLDRGACVEMKWTGHVALIRDGVVEQVDGQAAQREALVKIGCQVPAPVASTAAWRVAKSETLLYADLVEMYGKPESVHGTAASFTATWTVGAWARQANATVNEGVVTQFDGRPVNPALCCELVRHRAAAYRSPSETVQKVDASSRAFYAEVAKMAQERVRIRAAEHRDNGKTLLSAKLADVDSVGTWIGVTNQNGHSVCLRSAVDLTWKNEDGKTSTERRYVAVTVTQDGEKFALSECAVFPARL